MAYTDRLRQQHDLATIMTEHLCNLVRDHRPSDDATAIATQLARLIGVLRVHLAEEDEYLYPALMESHDRDAGQLAARFQTDMGALAWTMEEFMQRWSSSAVIALNFSAFRAALEVLLGTLLVRIACENETLYPVADAALARLAA